MRTDTNAPKREYFKEVKTSTFLLYWGSFLVWVPLVLSIVCMAGKTAIDIFFGIIFNNDFSIPSYFRGDFIDDLSFFYIFLFIFFVIIFYKGIQTYYQIKKKNPFAVITDEKFIIEFGKKSFSWDTIKTMKIKGDQIVVIIFDYKGKQKKEDFGLIWLKRKKDLIKNLKKKCIEKDIPFNESESGFISRIKKVLQ